MEQLSFGIDDIALKEVAAKLNTGSPLTAKDEREVQLVNAQLVSSDKDPVLRNKLAFQQLRRTLQPPVKAGEHIVVCDEEVKKRFDVAQDAARFVVMELRRPCYVHHELLAEESPVTYVDVVIPAARFQPFFVDLM
jgi:hypothetical protein